MKFKFKIQQYQTEAVENTVAVFSGQPSHTMATYRRDLGRKQQQEIRYEEDEASYRNARMELDDQTLLQQIRSIQNHYAVDNDWHSASMSSSKEHASSNWSYFFWLTGKKFVANREILLSSHPK